MSKELITCDVNAITNSALVKADLIELIRVEAEQKIEKEITELRAKLIQTADFEETYVPKLKHTYNAINKTLKLFNIDKDDVILKLAPNNGITVAFKSCSYRVMLDITILPEDKETLENINKEFNAILKSNSTILKELSTLTQELAKIPQKVKALSATLTRKALEGSDKGKEVLTLLNDIRKKINLPE